MEKYGVQIDDEKVKTAGTDKKCPKCGTDLSSSAYSGGSGQIVSPPWYCPNCGTEPFEKRPDPQPPKE